MKYFIPDWDDRVDPNYDFARDLHSPEHVENPVMRDAYMWDIFGVENSPFDGVLVSKMTIINNRIKYNRILADGIHKVLGLPKTFEIMGDCGAFGYIADEEPPFRTDDMLEYYLRCGFTYGIAVDHLIVPAFHEQNMKRWKLTIDNAREMFDLWQTNDKYMQSLRIIGSAQGWDAKSYRDAVKELLEIGYDYIAIGGLARSPTGNRGLTDESSANSKTLYNVVGAVSAEISRWMKDHRKKIDLHVFGVARLEQMSQLARYGVTSFDSASYLRRAWLSIDRNYLAFNGKSYGAIRIPQTDKSHIVRSSKDSDRLKLLEVQALEKVRGYDQERYSLQETLEAVLSYDKAIGVDRNFEAYYRKTLEDKPWKDCPCVICKQIGIEVIVFRGNNRNRRRGFHNTLAFYSRFRQSSPRIFAFTFCTAKKNTSEKPLTAFQRYGASSNMNAFWKTVYDLPIEIGMFSAKFGLVNWSDRIPNYDHKLQKDDIPRFITEFREKLRKYDKVFFIGLSGYRVVIEAVKKELGAVIEVFPKSELALREREDGTRRLRPLDIIEYRAQLKFFKRAILEFLPYSFSKEQEEVSQHLKEKNKEISLDRFLAN